MAETEDYLSKITCRYFRYGICHKAEQCRYSHNVEPAQLKTPIGDTYGVDYGVLLQHSGEITFNNFDDQLNIPSELSSCQDAEKDAEWTLEAVNWVNASEFVPGQLWQSLACRSSVGADDVWKSSEASVEDESSGYAVGGLGSCLLDVVSATEASSLLAADNCYPLSDVCVELCDMCGEPLPAEPDRQTHVQECIRHHEEEMELSFAVQCSVDKVCGICMEVIWDKEPVKEARFGILSNCSHIFCLSCIRRWRAAQQFDKKTVKACPECRVTSNFVVPSRYWFEEKESKCKLIADYQSQLRKKPCKYFNHGKGKCPFNEKCFYLHAYPDGRPATPQPPRSRSAHSTGGIVEDDDDDDDDDDEEDIIVLGQESLYEIIEQLNQRVTRLADQLENTLLRHHFIRNRTVSSSDDDDG